jgi:hypothetical protein
MAWGDGASTTSTVAGGLGKVIGDAVIAFNKANVILPLITSRAAVPGSNSVEFVDWTITGAGDVSAPGEGTAATAQAIATAAKTATISEHVLQSDITDLAQGGYGAGDLGATIGPVIGNALAAKLDDDIANLFAAGSLTQDCCGAGAAMSLKEVFDALRLLNGSSAPAPLNLVLGVKQTWGAKGIRTLITDAPSATTDQSRPYSSVAGAQGQDLANNGFVTRLAGFDIYTSPQVTEIAGDDEEGCAFSAGAFGVGIGSQGLFRIEPQRNAAKRLTEYVGTGFWGEVEIKDTFAVSFTSDVG